MRPDQLVPFDYKKQLHPKHSKRLNRSICLPSNIQSFNLATQFVKHWFISKFAPDTFKTVYIDGKNIFDEWRRIPRVELLKRPKPSLSVTPVVNWDFNNDNVDMYQFGLDTYQTRGMYKDSFFQDVDRGIYLGIAMQTLMVNFGIHCRVETRPLK